MLVRGRCEFGGAREVSTTVTWAYVLVDVTMNDRMMALIEVKQRGWWPCVGIANGLDLKLTISPA